MQPHPADQDASPGEPSPTTPTTAPRYVACPNCGSDLTGAVIGDACRQCGMIIGGGAFGKQNLPTSGKAVTSLVLGIMSLIGCFAYGLPTLICGPLAIFFARSARGQLERGEVNPGSEGLATAGRVCGIIGTVMAVIGIVVVVLIFAGLFSAAWFSSSSMPSPLSTPPPPTVAPSPSP